MIGTVVEFKTHGFLAASKVRSHDDNWSTKRSDNVLQGKNIGSRASNSNYNKALERRLSLFRQHSVFGAEDTMISTAANPESHECKEEVISTAANPESHECKEEVISVVRLELKSSTTTSEQTQEKSIFISTKICIRRVERYSDENRQNIETSRENIHDT